jgi:hypothetical protein
MQRRAADSALGPWALLDSVYDLVRVAAAFVLTALLVWLAVRNQNDHTLLRSPFTVGLLLALPRKNWQAAVRADATPGSYAVLYVPCVLLWALVSGAQLWIIQGSEPFPAVQAIMDCGLLLLGLVVSMFVALFPPSLGWSFSRLSMAVCWVALLLCAGPLWNDDRRHVLYSLASVHPLLSMSIPWLAAGVTVWMGVSSFRRLLGNGPPVPQPSVQAERR